MEHSLHLSKANRIPASGNRDCKAKGLLSGSVGQLGPSDLTSDSRLPFGHHWYQESEKDGEQRKMNEADVRGESIQNNTGIILILGSTLSLRPGYIPALGIHRYPYILLRNVL